ncbi:transcriptional regulator [Brunnivagina elsteri CCALA 953]|uniref:Transcriptional regulator n=2 Tax=Brunnivagina TaxID=3344733 RepID=A0A2A2TM23_9CYAN|nr:transcriptional regulator [Calothrix elsteri CCALA 953]
MQKTATGLRKKHQQLFDEMFKEFNLSSKEIAEKANISEGMFSRFRQGKSDFSAANLIEILLLVPSEAQIWYISQLFGKNPGNNWRSLLISASPEEIGEILRILADVYVSSNRETTDTAKELKAV